MAKTELRSEVEIDATPARVFTVLSDFARYPEWNPYLTAVQGQLSVGARLTLELSLPEGRAYDLAPEVTQLTENSLIRWRTRLWLPSLLEAEQFFLLREHAGKTRVMQGQDFSGFLLRFAGNSLTLAARGAVYMNQALKKRAESGA